MLTDLEAMKTEVRLAVHGCYPDTSPSYELGRVFNVMLTNLEAALLAGLPTDDPAVEGLLWNDSGDIVTSAG